MLNKQTIQCAYRDAVSRQLPEVRSIAAIGLANIYSAERYFDKANALYEEGLKIAKSMKHNWDVIYGSIYKTLTLHDSGMKQGTTQLIELSQKAAIAHFPYLQAVAIAMAAISALEMEDFTSARKLIEKGLTEKTVLIFPMAKAYLLGAAILSSKKLDMELTENFLNVIAQCHGIKGRPTLICKAFDKIEKYSQIEPVHREFITRWKARFTLMTDREKGVKLALCDYRKCEARCCYNGTYLSPLEAKSITNIVKENPEFFNHLPQKFLVQSEWHDGRGQKTAVKDYHYKSPDFPQHFEKTRCVFAFDDGACSLQLYSEKFTGDPWKYKPASCWIYPLNIENGNLIPPPYPGKEDSGNLGIVYPGYVSFTPCGQPRADGDDWKKTYIKESTRWEQLTADSNKE